MVKLSYFAKKLESLGYKVNCDVVLKKIMETLDVQTVDKWKGLFFTTLTINGKKEKKAHQLTLIPGGYEMVCSTIHASLRRRLDQNREELKLSLRENPGGSTKIDFLQKKIVELEAAEKIYGSKNLKNTSRSLYTRVHNNKDGIMNYFVGFLIKLYETLPTEKKTLSQKDLLGPDLFKLYIDMLKFPHEFRQARWTVPLMVPPSCIVAYPNSSTSKSFPEPDDGEVADWRVDGVDVSSLLLDDANSDEFAATAADEPINEWIGTLNPEDTLKKEVDRLERRVEESLMKVKNISQNLEHAQKTLEAERDQLALAKGRLEDYQTGQEQLSKMKHTTQCMTKMLGGVVTSDQFLEIFKTIMRNPDIKEAVKDAAKLILQPDPSGSGTAADTDKGQEVNSEPGTSSKAGEGNSEVRTNELDTSKSSSSSADLGTSSSASSNEEESSDSSEASVGQPKPRKGGKARKGKRSIGIKLSEDESEEDDGPTESGNITLADDKTMGLLNAAFATADVRVAPREAELEEGEAQMDDGGKLSSQPNAEPISKDSNQTRRRPAQGKTFEIGAKKARPEAAT